MATAFLAIMREVSSVGWFTAAARQGWAAIPHEARQGGVSGVADVAGSGTSAGRLGGAIERTAAVGAAQAAVTVTAAGPKKRLP